MHHGVESWETLCTVVILHWNVKRNAWYVMLFFCSCLTQGQSCRKFSKKRNITTTKTSPDLRQHQPCAKCCSPTLNNHGTILRSQNVSSVAGASSYINLLLRYHKGLTPPNATNTNTKTLMDCTSQPTVQQEQHPTDICLTGGMPVANSRSDSISSNCSSAMIYERTSPARVQKQAQRLRRQSPTRESAFPPAPA